MKLSKVIFSVFAFCPLLAGANVEVPVDSWAQNQIEKWAPPGVTWYPDARESEEEARERYQNIVRDLLSVTYDPTEKPLFSGPRGRARTTALMLSIAQTESGFRRDVDFGIGKDAKGDSGESHCLMQVRLSKARDNGKTDKRIHLDGPYYSFTLDGESGYGGEDLLADRKVCFRAALHIMRQSFHTCHRLPSEERLGIYTSGDCERGRRSSRVRTLQAGQILSRVQVTPDAEILDEGVEVFLNRSVAVL